MYIVLFIAVITVSGVSLAGYQYMQKTNHAREASVVAEQQFMEQMTSHHIDAIEMAQLAEQKAQTTSVKTLAGGIIVAQTQEVARMKTWYKQWYRKAIPEMAMMPGMMMNDGMDMNKLSSASDFDLEFIDQMLTHHESAVTMAKAILPKAVHQDITTLANSIITTQSQEIAQMKILKAGFEQYPAGSAGRHTLDCANDSPGSC